MKSRSGVCAMMVGLLTLALPADDAAARRYSCGECGALLDWEEETWYHAFGNWGSSYKPPYHTNYIPGSCLGSHEPCGGEVFFDRGGIEKLQVLVASGDWIGLQRFMRSVPTVHFNTTRNAIQVENCLHQIIAHFELPSTARELLTRAE